MYTSVFLYLYDRVKLSINWSLWIQISILPTIHNYIFRFIHDSTSFFDICTEWDIYTMFQINDLECPVKGKAHPNKF